MHAQSVRALQGGAENDTPECVDCGVTVIEGQLYAEGECSVSLVSQMQCVRFAELFKACCTLPHQYSTTFHADNKPVLRLYAYASNYSASEDGRRSAPCDMHSISRSLAAPIHSCVSSQTGYEWLNLRRLCFSDFHGGKVVLLLTWEHAATSFVGCTFVRNHIAKASIRWPYHDGDHAVINSCTMGSDPRVALVRCSLVARFGAFQGPLLLGS